MDIFAHGLWTNVMYRAIPQTRRNEKTNFWGIFFGIFPDIFAFTPVFAYIIFQTLFWGRSDFTSPQDAAGPIPLDGLTHILYGLSHSIVIWALIFGLTWLFIKKIPWPLLGWVLHICTDVFSHSNKFFPTPIFFPLSDFQINGWAWSDPVFMLVNYGSLLILYLFVIPRFRKNFHNKRPPDPKEG